MKDYQLKALEENKVGWFGRLLCRLGIHRYDGVYCVRCGARAWTLE